MMPLLAALVFTGCKETPTAPQQGGGSPAPPSSSGTWSITVTASPNSVEVGSNDPAAVTIVVRRVSDNSKPANGTTIAVATSLGSFDPNSTVQSGGVELFDGQVTVPLYAAGSPGTAVVRATLQGSVGSTNVVINGTSNFFIESVSPSTGSPSGGDVVRIRGGGFIEPVQVTFGGFPAEVLGVSSTTLRVRTPPAQLAPGEVSSVVINVTRDAGGENQGTVSLANGFTYTTGSVTGPQIYSVSPTSGPNEGGTRVVIRGDGFQSPVQVFFSGAAQVEAQVESVSSTQVVAISPPATGFGQPNLNQSVNIEVRNVNSGQVAVSQSAFRYGIDVLITSIAPGQGPYTGGTMVTIFGQGFDEPVAVSYGGRAQQVVSVTGTEILTRSVAIPVSGCSGDVSGPVSVTNIESGDTASGPSFTYLVTQYAPRVSGMSPTSGSASGGTTVTITGSNFTDPMSVDFGGSRASVQSVSGNQIVVTAPPFAGTFDTEACDAGGVAGERQVPTFVDVTVTSLDTTCSDVFGGGFGYNPTSATCVPTGTGGGGTGSLTAGFTAVPFDDAGTWKVTFTDDSTGDGIISYIWDFDTTGSLASPDTGNGPGPHEVTYASCTAMSPCSVTVKLTVTNNEGSNSATEVIDIPPP